MHHPCRSFNSSPEVIRLAVMMYVRDPVSLRQVEDLLCERGLDIGHETVRYWWTRVGPVFAAEIRKRRVHYRFYSLWRWHLDEVCVRINGTTHDLWRAVDHDGDVVEGVVTNRRDRRAARECLTRAMTRDGRPASIVTDRLPSSRAAMQVIGHEGGQEPRRWRNNRAEHSHQPCRRRTGPWLGSETSRPCRHSPPSRPRSTPIATTHASSIAATLSNTAEPPPWPSGVTLQSESP